MELKEKLYEVKNKRKLILEAAKALILEGKMEEHSAKMAEVEPLNTQIDAIEALLTEAEKGFNPDFGTLLPAATPGPDGKTDAVKAFAEAARAGFPVTKDMTEGADADGGYTVPADIVTRVETLRDAKASLRQLVGVESVATNKGRRTYKQRSQQTGFTKMGESGKIPKMASPQFSIVEYIISKFAGWLPVTNELMDDSDANIVQSITEWIADEARVTENKNILAVVKAKAAVALAGLDDIKKALIVTLGSAFLPTSKIITNDDGLFWLSALKDKNGRELLTPIPSEPGKMQLSVGSGVVPVVALPNGDLASTGTKIPFILGDLAEGIRLFDRKMLTITSSDVAVAGTFNAFEQDMTLTRAIIREDVKLRDGAAFIYGEVDTAAPPKV